MAGLLDWLSDAIGGVGNAATDPTTMGAMSSAGTPPVAPPQPPAPDPSQGQQPPMMPPGPAPQLGPDSPQNPMGGPVPMPMARPPEAGPGAPPPPSNRGPLQWTPPPIGSGGAPGPSVTAPSQSAPPVPIVPPGGGPGLPPGASSTEGMGAPPSSGPGPQARGILGRALGLDPNTERRLSGGLAAGFKAAGNSSGKSPFQALASGAGATLEGGDQADDKTTDKQSKYLDQAIKAAQMGDTRQLNQARTQLALAQTQMTLQGKGGNSVVNSDQQLYLRAQGATNQDANLKILKSQYDKIAMERGASSPEAKAAMDAYQKTYDDTLNGHLGRLGLDPKAAAKIGKQPGMTQDNPVEKGKLTSQEAFDKLPPGSWFVNPKDGKILQKPLAPIAPGAAQPAAPQGGQNLPAGQGGVPAPTGSNLPPMPPKAPTNPVASSIPGVDDEESADEKEAA